MRKKAIIVSAAVLLAAALGIWILLRPKTLGNISRSCELPESGQDQISFSGDEGERVRVSFSTQAQTGIVVLTLWDSQGTLVENLGQAKHLELWITLPKEDIYTLEAEYEDFAGRFSAYVTK